MHNVHLKVLMRNSWCFDPLDKHISSFISSFPHILTTAYLHILISSHPHIWGYILTMFIRRFLCGILGALIPLISTYNVHPKVPIRNSWFFDPLDKHISSYPHMLTSLHPHILASVYPHILIMSIRRFLCGILGALIPLISTRLEPSISFPLMYTLRWCNLLEFPFSLLLDPVITLNEIEFL